MKTWITKWLLGGVMREIADGKQGAGPMKVYWWLSGRKTAVSALAGLAFAALAAWQPALAKDWAPTVTLVLGVMVTVGLADRAWKDAPPLDEWTRWLSEILSAGPAISAAFALAIQLLPTVPGCDSCASFVPQLQWAAGAFAAVTAWLAARWNVPPNFPPRRVQP